MLKIIYKVNGGKYEQRNRLINWISLLFDNFAMAVWYTGTHELQHIIPTDAKSGNWNGNVVIKRDLYLEQLKIENNDMIKILLELEVVGILLNYVLYFLNIYRILYSNYWKLKD